MQDIIRLVINTGLVAKIVLWILFILSILSWALILQKTVRLIQVNRISKKFLNAYRQKKKWGEFYRQCNAYLSSPFAKVFIKGFQEFYYRKKENGEGQVPAHLKNRSVAVAQAMEVMVQDEMMALDRFLPLLATIVSISPFLGLFGTVWGVMEAFIRIGLRGASDITSVGPGIAEALITTVVGLFVAIPALAAYNLITASLKRLDNRLAGFISEFIMIIEREQIS